MASPPDSPESMVLVLETLGGPEQSTLLAAGWEQFRGWLFQALLDRARQHLAAGRLAGQSRLLA